MRAESVAVGERQVPSGDDDGAEVCDAGFPPSFHSVCLAISLYYFSFFSLRFGRRFSGAVLFRLVQLTLSSVSFHRISSASQTTTCYRHTHTTQSSFSPSQLT